MEVSISEQTLGETFFLHFQALIMVQTFQTLSKKPGKYREYLSSSHMAASVAKFYFLKQDFIIKILSPLLKNYSTSDVKVNQEYSQRSSFIFLQAGISNAGVSVASQRI